MIDLIIQFLSQIIAGNLQDRNLLFARHCSVIVAVRANRKSSISVDFPASVNLVFGVVKLNVPKHEWRAILKLNDALDSMSRRLSRTASENLAKGNKT